ncbi:hypothetical protein [Pseudomonas kitaguniensis]|uniref:hypothetical protein n=1 Tax=Pseudomonas kitaguniensis TaxID=2607908 RepID=UPI003B9F5BD5
MSNSVKPRTTSRSDLFLILGILAIAGIALAIYLDNKASRAWLAEYCEKSSVGVFSSKLECIARPIDR